jgi:ankyrin repeat protein
LAKGADINAGGDWTALQDAAEHHYDDIVELLLAKGARIDSAGEEGNRAVLLYAARHGWADVADRLAAAVKTAPLANKPDPVSGDTALHEAARNGDEKRAAFLIAYGGDPGLKNVAGNTPLHFVASDSHQDLVRLFLARGADTNAMNSYGDTPLHHAARRGQKIVVELLLAHGADPSIRNKRHLTPTEEAAANGYRDLAELLSHHDRKS